MENFKEIETTKEYDGYYYEVAEVISIVVLGGLCGLKNMKQVHQWAENERTREFLRKEQGIERIVLLLVSVPVEASKTGVAEPVPKEMGGAAAPCTHEVSHGIHALALGCPFWGRFLPYG